MVTCYDAYIVCFGGMCFQFIYQITSISFEHARFCYYHDFVKVDIDEENVSVSHHPLGDRWRLVIHNENGYRDGFQMMYKNTK